MEKFQKLSHAIKVGPKTEKDGFPGVPNKETGEEAT